MSGWKFSWICLEYIVGHTGISIIHLFKEVCIMSQGALWDIRKICFNYRQAHSSTSVVCNGIWASTNLSSFTIAAEKDIYEIDSAEEKSFRRQIGRGEWKVVAR